MNEEDILIEGFLSGKEIETPEQFVLALGAYERLTALEADLENEEASVFGLGELGAARNKFNVVRQKRIPVRKKRIAMFSNLKKFATQNKGIALNTGTFANLLPEVAMFMQKLNNADAQHRYVIDRLRSQSYKLIPHTYYSIIYMGGESTLNLLQDGMKAKSVLTNLGEGKIESEKYFLLTRIKLGSAVSTEGTAIEYAKKLNFDEDLQQSILNGEFSLSVDGKYYYTNCSAGIFDRTVSESGLRRHEILSPNPLIIPPQKQISFDLKAILPLIANTFVKVELSGLLTVNN